MKKFLNEFKTFALKGNVVDMAVGVIIGAAFQGIVTSLTNDVLNPLLGIAFSTDFSNVVFALPNNADPLRVGAFISAVLNFIIMAFVLFCIVKAMNRLMTLGQKKKAEEAPAAQTPEAPAALAAPAAPVAPVAPYSRSTVSSVFSSVFMVIE